MRPGLKNHAMKSRDFLCSAFLALNLRPHALNPCTKWEIRMVNDKKTHTFEVVVTSGVSSSP